MDHDWLVLKILVSSKRYIINALITCFEMFRADWNHRKVDQLNVEESKDNAKSFSPKWFYYLTPGRDARLLFCFSRPKIGIF